MKVLVIENNEAVARLLQSALESEGEEVTLEASSANLSEYLRDTFYDVIILDPAPLNDPRQIMSRIRQLASDNTYILLFSDEHTRADAQNAGMNDLLGKPVDHDELREKMAAARFMRKLSDHLTDESEDFPSAGGVISKSAFKQLYLSSLDRAGRYGENACIIMIGLSNFRDILENDGPYAAEFAAAKLSQNLVNMRRQADIIGQTDKHEYALLLIGPESSNEPVSAANRFAESLSKCSNLYEGGANQATIYVQAVFLPSGICLRDHHFQVATAGDVQQG